MSDNNKTQVTAILTITTENPEELRRILDHHMEYLIDTDTNHDLISGISEVKSYDKTDTEHRADKFQVLRQVIDDIRRTEPDSDEWDKLSDEDPKALELWEEIANMDNELDNAGY